MNVCGNTYSYKGCWEYCCLPAPATKNGTTSVGNLVSNLLSFAQLLDIKRWFVQTKFKRKDDLFIHLDLIFLGRFYCENYSLVPKSIASINQCIVIYKYHTTPKYEAILVSSEL